MQISVYSPVLNTLGVYRAGWLYLGSLEGEALKLDISRAEVRQHFTTRRREAGPALLSALMAGIGIALLGGLVGEGVVSGSTGAEFSPVRAAVIGAWLGQAGILVGALCGGQADRVTYEVETPEYGRIIVESDTAAYCRIAAWAGAPGSLRQSPPEGA